MPDLESLTLLELKKLAKENNIRNISKLKKELNIQIYTKNSYYKESFFK